MSSRASLPQGASSRSSRQSMAPRQPEGPKPPVAFSSSITISDSAQLIGRHTIQIGSESVVHPRARLDSHTGRVIIGRRCIIQERAQIGIKGELEESLGSSRGPSEEEPERKKEAVILGDYVTVEVGAVIEHGGVIIEEGCLLGVGSRVGKGAMLGKNCTLTPYSVIPPGEEIPPNTVIYSNGLRRTDQRELLDLKFKAQARQIDVLKRMIKSDPAKFQ